MFSDRYSVFSDQYSVVSKSAGQQVSKSASQQVSRSAGQQVSRLAGQQVSRSAGQQVSKLAGQQVSRLASQQVSRSAGQQVSRSAGPQVSCQQVSKLASQRVSNQQSDPQLPNYQLPITDPQSPNLPISQSPNTPIHQYTILTTAILLIAALFRLWALSDVPPGLAQDEVLNADIVTFIRGGEQALFFRHGFGHEPLYHYFAVPFQILFGDNVLSIRLPAFYLGMVLIALAMRWARREFGMVTAVTTGTLLAISWWPIIFSRIGLRPIMEPVFLLLMAWFWKRPYLAGLFLGLSFYTYTGARVVLVIPVVFALVRFTMGQLTIDGRSVAVRHLRLTISRLFGASANRKNNPQSPITQLPNYQLPNTTPQSPIPQSPNPPIHQYTNPLITTLTALLIALPMQLTLWRDPTLQSRVDQLSGPLDALRVGDFGPIWQTITATLGVFSFTGDPRWTYMVPERPLFDPLTSLFFYGGLLVVLFNLRKPQYLFSLVWLGVTLIPSAITPQAPSTIRIIGALPAVYLLVGLGVNWVWQRGNSMRWALGIFFAGLFLFNGAQTIQMGFVEWPQSEETRFKYQSVLLDMSRYLREEETAVSPTIADTFYEPIDADSLRRNLGTDPQARWVQLSPNAGAVVWPHGQQTQLLVPEFAPIPPALQQQLTIPTEPSYRSTNDPSFAVYQLPPLDFAPLPEPLLFDNRIRLLGVEMEPISADGQVHLFTYWEVVDALPWDLTAFVHVLGDDPQPVVQHDGFDVAPERLQPSDIVVQHHVMPPPTDRERPYAIHIGLYTNQNGQRLPINSQATLSWIYKDNFIFDQNAHDE